MKNEKMKKMVTEYLNKNNSYYIVNSKNGSSSI